jgi:hypothetical protein
MPHHWDVVMAWPLWEMLRELLDFVCVIDLTILGEKVFFTSRRWRLEVLDEGS